MVLTGALMENSIVPRTIQASLALLVLLVWFIYRRGWHSFAATVMIWGFWGFATLVVLSESGRASPWLVPQFLLVIVARFLLNGRIAIFLGLITAILDLAFYGLNIQITLPMELRDLTQHNDWAAPAVSFFFLLFIFFLTDTVLRETLRTAHYSQGRYRALFDHTNDAVFLLDMNQRYIEANQAAADLLGYPRDELIGKSILEVVPQEEAKAVRNNFQKLDKESSLPLFERTFVRSDGSRRITEVSITVVPAEDGGPRYYQSVIRDISERKRLEHDLRYSLEEMESLAMQDPLTGLLNRRAITEHGDAEWHRAKRDKRPLCVAIVDLDNLKIVNDTLGHMTGDKALNALSNAIKISLRRYDWAGRWGGDEFMLLLPGANLVEAKEICERLRRHYAESDFVSNLEPALQPHLSIGIACYSGRAGDEMQLNQLFVQADTALYQAKQAGKDQVAIFRDDLLQSS
jgi:diguanylate cyclase (GGDEF)-like protein/PAS domain S-box-containing protein